MHGYEYESEYESKYKYDFGYGYEIEHQSCKYTAGMKNTTKDIYILMKIMCISKWIDTISTILIPEYATPLIPYQLRIVFVPIDLKEKEKEK